MPYNPFNKPLGDKLEPEDLDVLIVQQVTEGYFVEYKQQMPSTEKIARSLASLANTYGGWYIVGVLTDQHNVAKQVTGFNPSSCHDPISTVRDLVKHHIDPIPVIFPEVVQLRTGNIVLLVYVPGEQETPFVTLDGRIYRRTYDSSDPVPEASRYALDQLVERGKATSKLFEDFTRDVRIFSKAEKHGWLNIYISPYPFGLVEHLEIMSTTTAGTLLSMSKDPIEIPFESPEISISGNIPFNTAYSTPNSMILQQTDIKNEGVNTLSLEIDVSGRTKLHIPLQYSSPIDWIMSNIQSNEAKQKLVDRFFPPHGTNRNHLRLYEIGSSWVIIATLVNFYLKWLGNQPALYGFYVAIELKGVWRYVAFCDLDSWGRHVDQFGLPILMRDKVRIPGIEGKGYIIRMDSYLWINLCWQVALAFGLPTQFFAEALLPVMVKASAKGKQPV